ncbi:MAG: hypothetical protein QOG64_3084 [Acidimicrobiaceae bacterium]|nr:hypothetical protein [Acidimicrobiaceae bacterium]
MVSFRFYLVSVIAVFLALAVGIAMGATVIDKATVDLLRNNIRTAEAHASAADQQHRVDSDKLQQATAFEDAAAATLVKGRLPGIPVVMVGVAGGQDQQPNMDKLHDLLVAAGAEVEATVTLTAKWKLDKPADATALADALTLPSTTPPEQLRTIALDRLAAAWSGGLEVPSPLPTLVRLQFAQLKAGTVADAVAIPALHSRFVAVSSTQPEVPDDVLAVPFVQELARNLPFQVMAAEAGQVANPAEKKPEIRELLVGPLRSNDLGVSSKLATVDNIDEPRGRMAAVYALQNLGAQKVGHYGVGAHADGLFPPPQ